jgi:hypothetical protein
MLKKNVTSSASDISSVYDTNSLSSKTFSIKDGSLGSQNSIDINGIFDSAIDNSVFSLSKENFVGNPATAENNKIYALRFNGKMIHGKPVPLSHSIASISFDEINTNTGWKDVAMKLQNLLPNKSFRQFHEIEGGNTPEESAEVFLNILKSIYAYTILELANSTKLEFDAKNINLLVNNIISEAEKTKTSNLIYSIDFRDIAKKEVEKMDASIENYLTPIPNTDLGFQNGKIIYRNKISNTEKKQKVVSMPSFQTENIGGRDSSGVIGKIADVMRIPYSVINDLDIKHLNGEIRISNPKSKDYLSITLDKEGAIAIASKDTLYNYAKKLEKTEDYNKFFSEVIGYFNKLSTYRYNQNTNFQVIAQFIDPKDMTIASRVKNTVSKGVKKIVNSVANTLPNIARRAIQMRDYDDLLQFAKKVSNNDILQKNYTAEQKAFFNTLTPEQKDLLKSKVQLNEIAVLTEEALDKKIKILPSNLKALAKEAKFEGWLGQSKGANGALLFAISEGKFSMLENDKTQFKIKIGNIQIQLNDETKTCIVDTVKVNYDDLGSHLLQKFKTIYLENENENENENEEKESQMFRKLNRNSGGYVASLSAENLIFKPKESAIPKYQSPKFAKKIDEYIKSINGARAVKHDFIDLYLSTFQQIRDLKAMEFVEDPKLRSKVKNYIDDLQSNIRFNDDVTGISGPYEFISNNLLQNLRPSQRYLLNNVEIASQKGLNRAVQIPVGEGKSYLMANVNSGVIINCSEKDISTIKREAKGLLNVYAISNFLTPNIFVKLSEIAGATDISKMNIETDADLKKAFALCKFFIPYFDSNKESKYRNLFTMDIDSMSKSEVTGFAEKLSTLNSKLKIIAKKQNLEFSKVGILFEEGHRLFESNVKEDNKQKLNILSNTGKKANDKVVNFVFSSATLPKPEVLREVDPSIEINQFKSNRSPRSLIEKNIKQNQNIVLESLSTQIYRGDKISLKEADIRDLPNKIWNNTTTGFGTTTLLLGDLKADRQNMLKHYKSIKDTTNFNPTTEDLLDTARIIKMRLKFIQAQVSQYSIQDIPQEKKAEIKTMLDNIYLVTLILKKYREELKEIRKNEKNPSDGQEESLNTKREKLDKLSNGMLNLMNMFNEYIGFSSINHTDDNVTKVKNDFINYFKNNNNGLTLQNFTTFLKDVRKAENKINPKHIIATSIMAEERKTVENILKINILASLLDVKQGDIFKDYLNPEKNKEGWRIYGKDFDVKSLNIDFSKVDIEQQIAKLNNQIYVMENQSDKDYYQYQVLPILEKMRDEQLNNKITHLNFHDAVEDENLGAMLDRIIAQEDTKKDIDFFYENYKEKDYSVNSYGFSAFATVEEAGTGVNMVTASGLAFNKAGKSPELIDQIRGRMKRTNEIAGQVVTKEEDKAKSGLNVENLNEASVSSLLEVMGGSYPAYKQKNIDQGKENYNNNNNGASSPSKTTIIINAR